MEEEEPKGLLKINPRVQQEQIKFLSKIKAERNSDSVNLALKKLKSAAQGNDNLMPFIVAAVKNYASIGEICNTMRDVFGEYKEHVII